MKEVIIKIRNAEERPSLEHKYEILHDLQNLNIAVSAFGILFGDKDQIRGSNQENLSIFAGLVLEKGGESLAMFLDRQRKNSKLNLHKKKDLFVSLLNIVDGLHKAKVVHLDIKHDNIVKFKNQHDEDVWKLIDFDYSRFEGQAISNQLTPAYASYEQASYAQAKNTVAAPKAAFSMPVTLLISWRRLTKGGTPSGC
jgi:serine/threonine protein kinase